MKANDNQGLKVLVVCVAVILVVDRGVRADFTFGRPTNPGPNINSSSIDAGTSISADGCTLYFSSTRPGGRGGWELWVATRLTTDADWGPPENLGPTVNTPSDDGPGSISADGLSLYFASNRPGGFGSYDTWVTTRATKADKWSIPVNLGPTVNSATGDDHPSISADGLSLYFVSNRAGGNGSQDLWVTTRATLSHLWGPPVNLGSTVNSSNYEEWPSISADGLLLFFYSDRASKSGPHDIWVTRRATVSDPWGLPVNLGPPVNTSANDFGPNVSADGRTFYFTSDRPGGYGSFDIWQAPVIPIVDFTSDGKVDIQDLLRLIESWGKDDPSMDIGPMPWGDGKVDEKDLEVLMSYWQQEVLPVSLIAYWKLDEAEGIVAADKAGTNNGTLVGDPIWQPAGGKLGGALQLDGIDDYVRTPFVVDPAKGPFSVFAWVKGGAPGQVILSQVEGANWLRAAPATGKLQTELNEPGRNAAKNLQSPVAITDGAWHRVGVVWDGAKRILYVADAEVASDTRIALVGSAGGLQIGAGANLAAGSFWSGLIDDVRIYDQAVTP